MREEEPPHYSACVQQTGHVWYLGHATSFPVLGVLLRGCSRRVLFDVQWRIRKFFFALLPWCIGESTNRFFGFRKYVAGFWCPLGHLAAFFDLFPRSTLPKPQNCYFSIRHWCSTSMFMFIAIAFDVPVSGRCASFVSFWRYFYLFVLWFAVACSCRFDFPIIQY